MRWMRRRGAPLDVAIVGCGAVVDRLYQPAFRALEARGIARVSALVDPDPDRTRSLARHFRSARACRDVAEAMPAVLTLVTSPAALHAEHALTAIAAGSHVLCEKPMTTTTDDATRMLDAARSAGRVLAVGMTRRLYPCVADARELIARGSLGAHLRFVHREGLRYDWPVSTAAAFRRSTAGGGVLIDVGSHALDLLGLLFGPLAVDTYADDGDSFGVETNCRVELTSTNATGLLQLSWNEPLVTMLHVIGTEGELVLDPRVIDVLRWRAHGREWTSLRSARSWPVDLDADGRRATPRSHAECISLQLVQVLRAIALGEDPPARGEDGLATVAAIAACYAKATPLRLPWLDAAEQARRAERHWTRERWAAA